MRLAILAFKCEDGLEESARLASEVGVWELYSLCFLLTRRLLHGAAHRFYKPNKQSRRLGDIGLWKTKGSERRFISGPVGALTAINFSWLAHCEHSQPQGANAKLICVLKVLS